MFTQSKNGIRTVLVSMSANSLFTVLPFLQAFFLKRLSGKSLGTVLAWPGVVSLLILKIFNGTSDFILKITRLKMLKGLSSEI
jgi:hypothetical protein